MHDDTEFEPVPDASTDSAVPLEAHVVEYDDRPDECTIHPAWTPDCDWTTTWISAQDDSFVALADWR